MKTHRFILELEFSEDVNTESDLQQVVNNIAQAIHVQIDNGYICPEGGDSDAYTVGGTVHLEADPDITEAIFLGI